MSCQKINYINTNTDSTQMNNKCKLRGNRYEAVNYIRKFNKLTQKE